MKEIKGKVIKVTPPKASPSRAPVGGEGDQSSNSTAEENPGCLLWIVGIIGAFAFCIFIEACTTTTQGRTGNWWDGYQTQIYNDTNWFGVIIGTLIVAGIAYGVLINFFGKK